MNRKQLANLLRQLPLTYRQHLSLTLCPHGYEPNTCPWPASKCENAHPQDIVMIEPSLLNLPPPPPGVDLKMIFPTVLFERRVDEDGEWSWKVKEVVKAGTRQ